MRLPPLRERLEDISDLVRHFLVQVTDEGLPLKALDGGAIDRLKKHAWPGNVRELENLIRRVVALYSEEVIGLAVIEAELADAEPSMTSAAVFEIDNLETAVDTYLGRYFSSFGEELPPVDLYARILRDVERPLVTQALAATKGNQIKASELLGLNRNTLRKKIKELDIQVTRGVK